LQAIHTEAQYAYTRDRVQHLRAHGHSVELLTSREARGLEPGLNPALMGCWQCGYQGDAIHNTVSVDITNLVLYVVNAQRVANLCSHARHAMIHPAKLAGQLPCAALSSPQS